MAPLLAGGGPGIVRIEQVSPSAEDATSGVFSAERAGQTNVWDDMLDTRAARYTADAGDTHAPASTAVAASPQEDEDDGGLRIHVPFRSQWDGSTYEWGNCGVAAITMAMEYYGHSWSTHDVRVSINTLTGDWSTKSGLDWRYLKIALERRGFAVQGPYTARGGYQYWSLDDILAQTEQGRPVILLVHYRSLPGHEDDEWPGDHYIVFLGLTRDGGVIYHDPGFPGDEGANRIIDQATLDRAWSKTWIGQNRTAMVVVGPN